MYYSLQDFDVLQKSTHETTRRVADLISRSLGEIEAELIKNGIKELKGKDLCFNATELLQKKLKEAGFPAKILEGDIIIAPNESLEHRINWIKGPEEWVIIDLTAEQIPKQKGKRLLVKSSSPNKEALKQILKEEYDWWFPEN